MAEYRLYFIDVEGRGTGCAEFSSIDDQSAQAEAQQLVGQAGGELWRGPRWVNTWVAGGEEVRAVNADPPQRKAPNGNRQRAAYSSWARRRSGSEWVRREGSTQS